MYLCILHMPVRRRSCPICTYLWLTALLQVLPAWPSCSVWTALDCWVHPFCQVLRDLCIHMTSCSHDHIPEAREWLINRSTLTLLLGGVGRGAFQAHLTSECFGSCPQHLSRDCIWVLIQSELLILLISDVCTNLLPSYSFCGIYLMCHSLWGKLRALAS